MINLLSLLLNKLPWVARLPFYIALFLVWLLFKGLEYGAKAPAEAEAWFDRNYERNYAPVRSVRQEQFNRIGSDISEIKQDTRDIKNILMSKDRK